MEEKILQTKKNGMTMLLLTLLGYAAAIIVFVLGGILLTAEHNVPGVILLVLSIVYGIVGIFLLCVPYMMNATYQSFLYAQF